MTEDFRKALGRAVDPNVFPRPMARSAPWYAQVEELSFWICALSCLLLIGIQAFVTFDYNASHSLTDYGSLYASSKLANLHANPYRDDPLVFHIREIDRHGHDTRLQGSVVNAINLNPPVLLYPFRLLARLNPDASFFAWTCVSATLFCASVVLIIRTYPAQNLKIRILWILSLGAVWYTFRLGQIYMILLFCTTVAWWALRKQKWLTAGIAIGMICAIKPNFLVWPALMVLGRSRKAGFTAFATTATLSAIPLLTQGPGIYRLWLAACRAFNGYELPGNASLLATFSRAGLPTLGLALTLGMLSAAAIWIFVTKPDALFTSEVAILAALFAGPISWLGYSIMLVPVLYGKSMDTLTRVGCLLLCVPIWFVIPYPDTLRATYILFWAPNLYGLGLIASSVVRSGIYWEDCQSVSAIPRSSFSEILGPGLMQRPIPLNAEACASSGTGR